jgi:hypothetical protein
MESPRSKRQTGRGGRGQQTRSSSSSRGRSTSTRASSRSSGSTRSSSRRGARSSSAGRGGAAQSTKDLEEIRSWAEARGGKPATVKSTAGRGKSDGAGILRIDFPGYSGAGSLEEIPWDEWYQKFQENNLTFLYQDQTKDGRESRFFKLVCEPNKSKSRSSSRSRSRATSSSRSRSHSRSSAKSAKG